MNGSSCLTPVWGMLLVLLTLQGCRRSPSTPLFRAPNLSMHPASQPMLQPPPKVTLTVPLSRPPEHANNSLWQTGAKSFLRDQRSCRLGDTVLVLVNLKDEKATLKYKTVLNTPKTTVEQNVNSLAGFENQLKKILPKNASPTQLLDLSKNQNHKADTSSERKESVTLKVPATLVKQMNQGHFLIYGHQQVMVNYDRRDVYIAGIIDPKNINQDNTISYQDIAEVRLVYGGVGTLQDAQQKKAFDRWLQEFFPF